MIHPDTELRFVNETIGMGVFAKRLLPRGTITWVRDELDMTIPDADVSAIPELLQPAFLRYCYRYGGEHILCWDISRFMNHSCEPNCLGTYNFEIAVRDILPGHELTDDYSVFYLEASDAFSCACNTAGCRKRILPDDPQRLADDWDALYLPAFGLITTVEQPLMPLVKEADEIERGRTDPGAILSHRQLYIEGEKG